MQLEKNKRLLTRLIKQVWGQADGQKIKLASSECLEFVIKQYTDIKQAVDTLLAVDDTMGIYTDGGIWFLVDVYAENTDECIIDYTDNQVCNDIFNNTIKGVK